MHSQIYYDFESQDIAEWIQKPASSWELTNSSAISGTKSLMHSLKDDAGQDTIFVPINGITFDGHDVTWKFMLKHQQDPSGTNKWAVILAANHTENNFNGYAIGVDMNSSSSNTSDKLLYLYKVHNRTFTELLKTNINWQATVTKNNSAIVEIKRDYNNFWKIGLGNDFSNISFYDDSIKNEDYTDISFFGILYVFTKTASDKFFIDEIHIDAENKIVPKEANTEILAPEEQIVGENISSVNKDTVEVFKFEIKDVAGIDTFSTYLKQVTVKNAKPPASADWKQTIKNACLYVENTLIPCNITVGEDSIRCVFDETLFIPSGETKKFSLKIALNDYVTDNSTLQFKIDKDNHGFISSNTGSGMVAALNDDIVSGIFTIIVDADRITLKDVPDMVAVNSKFSLTATATDSNGNIDTDFSYPADLILTTEIENVTFDDVSTFAYGNLTVNEISYNKPENISIQLSANEIFSPNIPIAVILDRTSTIEPAINEVTGTTIPSNAISIDKEVAVLKFVISDIGGDNSPTFVEEIKFENPVNETNWSNIIGGVSLYDGTKRLITNIIEQKKEYIRVSLFSGSLAIDDGTSKEITLKIWLKTKATDKTVLQFKIPETNHGFKASQNGSLFSDNFSQNIISDIFDIDVKAKNIIFKTIPSIVAPNAPFSAEVNAVSEDGTIDIDETGIITLSPVPIEANLQSVSGLEQAASSGKAVWNDLIIGSPVIFRIKATHPSLGEIISNEIAGMDTDSYLSPVLSQYQAVFKSTDTSVFAAQEAIRFKISDKGTNDGISTIIDKMIFYCISENPISGLVGGAKLVSDEQPFPISVILTENQIQITSENIDIPDGESKEFVLKLFLKPAPYADGIKFQLYIPANNHGWTVKTNSSQLSKNFDYPIYSEIHSIDIEASKLTILNQPMIVQKEIPFDITVGATDYFGNVDTSFSSAMNILKNSGTGNIQAFAETQTSGITTYNISYDSSGYFSLKVANTDGYDIMTLPLYSVNVIDTVCKSGISSAHNTGDWIQNGSKWTHNYGDGLSYLSYPMNIDMDKGIVQWDFVIETGNFDPSAENAFWCVLSSDKEDLGEDKFSGYVAGVNYTGNSDLISFWKVKNGEKQILWESNYNWDANNSMQIIVQKHDGDKWKIFTKEKGLTRQFAGEFSDNEFTENEFS
ncbi:MAG: hypothetical protein LBR10_02775, partial [Prevotellaceae bacterium]|nr:hypothetical protein [Prevotellaceae bacterium]